MDFPLFEDDLDEPGVIQADTMHAKRDDVPSVALLCFFNDLLDELFREGKLKQIYTLRSEIGSNPVFEFVDGSSRLCVVHPGVGAPLAAGVVEELSALGVKTFVACGGAGALRDDLALGHVMIVASALRDEGTSFHYAKPSRIIDADPLGVSVLTRTLQDLHIPHYVGRAWTTDAMFRETRQRVLRRIDESCSMVDMESSAFIAVSRFKGLRFAQLLYAGDSLAGDEWDSRHWDSARDVRERLFHAARACALALHEQPSSAL